MLAEPQTSAPAVAGELHEGELKCLRAGNAAWLFPNDRRGA
jgi:hypothetical protein